MKIFLPTLLLSLFFYKSTLASNKIYSGIGFNYQSITFDKTKALISDGTIIDDIVKSQYPNEIVMPVISIGIENNRFRTELYYNTGSESKYNKTTGIGANNIGDLGKFSKTFPNPLYTNNSVKSKTIGIDIKPFKKIDDFITLYGILGINYNKILIEEISHIDYKTNIKTFTYKNQTSGISPNLGAGVEFKISPFFSFDTQIKYNYFNKNINTSQFSTPIRIKNILNVSASLIYFFN